MNKAAVLKILAAAGVKLTGVVGWLISQILPVIIDKAWRAGYAWWLRYQADKKRVAEAKAAAEKAKAANDADSTDSAIDDQLGSF